MSRHRSFTVGSFIVGVILCCRVPVISSEPEEPRSNRDESSNTEHISAPSVSLPERDSAQREGSPEPSSGRASQANPTSSKPCRSLIEMSHLVPDRNVMRMAFLGVGCRSFG